MQPVLDGDARSCFAMTEPEHAGSNPTVMSTTARLLPSDGGADGDRQWVLDGHKWFTTGFDGAAWMVVMAVTDPRRGPRPRGGRRCSWCRATRRASSTSAGCR